MLATRVLFCGFGKHTSSPWPGPPNLVYRRGAHSAFKSKGNVALSVDLTLGCWGVVALGVSLMQAVCFGARNALFVLRRSCAADKKCVPRWLVRHVLSLAAVFTPVSQLRFFLENVVLAQILRTCVYAFSRYF